MSLRKLACTPSTNFHAVCEIVHAFLRCLLRVTGSRFWFLTHLFEWVGVPAASLLMAVLFIFAEPCSSTSSNKPRMRVVPRRPSASISSTHTQARLPFTQPTMQLSIFKAFHSSFNRETCACGGWRSACKSFPPGSLRMQLARERSVANLLPAGAGAGIRLFCLRVSLAKAGRRCTFRSRNLRGLARRSAFKRMQALAIDRSRTCAAGFSNPLRGSHVHACPGIKLDIRPIIARGAPTACGLAGQ